MRFVDRIPHLRDPTGRLLRLAVSLGLGLCVVLADAQTPRALSSPPPGDVTATPRDKAPQLPAAPQTTADMQAIIDDDLEAQANAEMAAGHPEQALKLLNELVERDPRRAGALLEAAVLHCALGDPDLTRQTLSRIQASYNVPPAIEKLIQVYRTNTCVADARKPQLIAAVRAGVTSNANFGPSDPTITFADTAPFHALVLAPESLAHSDQFVESSLQGELPVRAVPGLTSFAGLTQRQYRDLHDFDQRIASVGVVHQYTFEHGTSENQAAVDVFWLGSRLYQSDVSLHTGYWTPLTVLRNSLARAGFDFTVTDTRYPSNSLYNSVRLELRAAIQARIGERATAQLFAGPVWELPSGDRPGSSRHGYTAWFALNYDLERYGQFEAVLQRRTLIDSAPYDTVFFGSTIQNQTLQSISLQYAYPLARHWSLYTRFSAQRVSNSIEPFAYSVREGSVGLSWKY
jgi:tetratricopeptide (TPR) repeat protein